MIVETTRATARKDAPWETKGRGIAVFRCLDTPPLPEVQLLSGTLFVTPDGPLPELTGDEQRIVFKDLPERFFSEQDNLADLIHQVLLPAFRLRIPLYFFTECAQELFRAGALPFGSQEALADSLLQLAREQMGALLAQMCIIFPSPDAVAELAGPPMTPIEQKLAKALTRAGLTFEAQVPRGPYILDFTLVTNDGLILAVEADGREFHHPERDDARDQSLKAEHGIAEVLRFSGSSIWNNPDLCAQRVREQLSRLARHWTLPVRPLPEPLPALSDEQEKCLTPQHGVVLTLAPAGSGKTRVLTRRVVEAVRAGVAPERILCVVFNRHAREVMEQRIHQERGLPQVVVRTLHSIGFEVAREALGSRYARCKLLSDEAVINRLYRDAIAKDLQRQAEPADTFSSQRLFVKDDLVEACREYASTFKKTLTALGQPLEVEGVEQFDSQQAARVSTAVDEELLRRNLITFDDMIYRGVETLLASPHARRQYQQRFDVVLVDEFQDLTPVQFLLVRLLALPLNNLFVVGDDDQMINSFACADPRNITDFRTLFKGARVHTLGENHRCAPEIVRRSANAISHNRVREPKPIRPALRNGEPAVEEAGAFRTFVGDSPTAEALEAARTIRQWAEAGAAYRDMAVLVRVKTVASIVQIALKKEGIPFIPLDRAVFFTSRVGRLLGAYLRLCLRPETVPPAELRLALGTPPRYLKREVLEQVEDEGWALLSQTDRFPAHSQRLVQDFNREVQAVHAYNQSSGRTSLDVFSFLLQRFGLEEYFRKEDRNSVNTGISTGGEIIALVRSLAADHPRFEGFVDWFHEQMREEEEAARRPPSPRNENGQDEDKVAVATIHSCKGAEYRSVVLFHVAEGTLPHTHSVATGLEAALEEERRVFYVGLTRAIERLLVTTEKLRPSRFIAELDQPRPEPPPFDPQKFAPPPAEPIASGWKPDREPPALLATLLRFLGRLFGIR